VLLLFFTPVHNSQEVKKMTLCNTEKYKNQAGMNLTHPPPSLLLLLLLSAKARTKHGHYLVVERRRRGGLGSARVGRRPHRAAAPGPRRVGR